MFLFIFVAAVSIEDKEDFCFLLSSKLVRSRSAEIDEYILSTPTLKIPAIRSKLQEDSFNACVEDKRLDKFTEDLVLKSYSKYNSLISIPLEKYKTQEDLSISSSFSKRRPEIQKRAMMKPRSFKDL
jgi:hypothetical protein